MGGTDRRLPCFPWPFFSDVTATLRRAKEPSMILAASQFYFWYFGYPTPLAPAEDRSA
jgi:hypothetical protein